jgi:signal transduction histidine kinase
MGHIRTAHTTKRENRMIKRRALIALYAVCFFAYVFFLFYFLSLHPGGASGDSAVIMALACFASGGMIMMAVYMITLYMFQGAEKAALYFTLFCVATGLRFLVMDGSFVLVQLIPGFTETAAISIRYFLIGLHIIGVTNFIIEVFAAPGVKRRLPVINGIVTAMSWGAVAAFLLGARPLYINAVMLLIQSLTIYCIYIIAKSPGLKQNRLHLMFFICMILYSLTVVINALLTAYLPHLTVTTNTIFLIAHIILLSDRSAKTKRHERELAERTEFLDKLNRIKTEFLQDMSHEMKKPLTIIATGIDYADSEISETDGSIFNAREALENIREETQRLGRMVGGMVSLAAMSDDSENRKRVDFTALLKNSADMFQMMLKRQDIRLRTRIASGLPDVFIEKDRFTQVLTNLFSNSADQMQRGEITLTAVRDGSYITVCVTDDGEGIPSELLPRVFERSVSGKEGTGYGLYICKTVVEAHGGTIQIESPVAWAGSSASAERPTEPSKGTAVTFTVPVYSGQEAGHNL